MEISVKAYLGKNNDFTRSEIRRFRFDKLQGKTYKSLVERLLSIFPSLTKGMFTTAWKDEEDELITFSSNEEFSIAIKNLPAETNLLRVYIRDKSGIVKETDEDTKAEYIPVQTPANQKFRCANHCLEVEGVPVIDGFGRVLCSQCFNSGHLPYKCKKCGNTQYIKYHNLKPENTWFCHNVCQTWTNWTPVPENESV